MAATKTRPKKKSTKVVAYAPSGITNLKQARDAISSIELTEVSAAQLLLFVKLFNKGDADIKALVKRCYAQLDKFMEDNLIPEDEAFIIDHFKFKRVLTSATTEGETKVTIEKKSKAYKGWENNIEKITADIIEKQAEVKALEGKIEQYQMLMDNDPDTVKTTETIEPDITERKTKHYLITQV